MTVTRELVTKLSFAFDRENLNKFERAISGFKTKFNIAALAFQSSLGKVFEFASSIADASVSTKDLADYAGIAVKDFVALQNAAKNFSIKPEQFNEVIQGLSIGIKEASRGFGNFFKIVKETQGRVNFKGLHGELLSTKDVLLQIFDEINRIQDQSEKLRILSNIPGISAETAGAWLRAIEGGRENFTALVEKEIEFGNRFQESLQDMIEFQQEVSILGKEWEKLTTIIGQIVVPHLTETLKGTNALVEVGKEEGFGSVLKASLASFADALDFSRLFHDEDERAEMILNKIRAEDPLYQDLRERESKQNQLNVVNNNRFDINVPQGTTEQQAVSITEQLKLAWESLWQEKTREVFNNSPQVE